MCLDACRLAGVPLIVHFHGFDAYDRATLQAFGDGYSRLFREARAIVAVSRHMEQVLIGLGTPRDRLHYNPYGVDTRCFQGAVPASARPRFLAVGRFVDKKAPCLTLLAFSQVVKAVPEAELVMIGDGPLLEATRQVAHALGIASRVSFEGPRRPVEVADAMRQSRVFVQHSVVPSSGDSEGTPVAILEASASGLPIVATRHRGITDVVIEDVTGLLVDERDVQGMASQMLRVATDNELAGRLGQAARQNAIERFSLEDRIAALWEIISVAASL
jgi:glycosyltransferase involved in cell wall biosynthesis